MSYFPPYSLLEQGLQGCFQAEIWELYQKANQDTPRIEVLDEEEVDEKESITQLEALLQIPTGTPTPTPEESRTSKEPFQERNENVVRSLPPVKRDFLCTLQNDECILYDSKMETKGRMWKFSDSFASPNRSPNPERVENPEFIEEEPRQFIIVDNDDLFSSPEPSFSGFFFSRGYPEGDLELEFGDGEEEEELEKREEEVEEEKPVAVEEYPEPDDDKDGDYVFNSDDEMGSDEEVGAVVPIVAKRKKKKKKNRRHRKPAPEPVFNVKSECSEAEEQQQPVAEEEDEPEMEEVDGSRVRSGYRVELKPCRRKNTGFTSNGVLPQELCSHPYKYVLRVSSNVVSSQEDFEFYLSEYTVEGRDARPFLRKRKKKKLDNGGVNSEFQRTVGDDVEGPVSHVFHVQFSTTTFLNQNKEFRLNVFDLENQRSVFTSRMFRIVARKKKEIDDLFWDQYAVVGGVKRKRKKKKKKKSVSESVQKKKKKKRKKKRKREGDEEIEEEGVCVYPKKRQKTRRYSE